MAARTPGTVIGRAGGSLAGAAQFGQAGKVGASGEARTARLLAQLAATDGGPTVIHDVRIPIPGFTANIDHVVISGREITLLDTKVWRDGFYWTLGGVTRRGLEAAPHTDKQTLGTGVNGIGRMLRNMGVPHRFRRSVLVVWPGSRDAAGPNLTFYRPRDAVAIVARDEAATARRLTRLTGSRPADPQLVSAVSRILYV